MRATAAQNERIANMVFGSVYPLYINKIEKKGRTKKELDQVIHWLTGFDETDINQLITEKVTFKTFLNAQHFIPMHL